MKLFKPHVSWRAIRNVVRVLKSGYIAEGDEVRRFEERFAKKFQLPPVVAVNSGTSALELAYELAGISEGDEVITPVLTMPATNIPLVRRKAKIVFADISRDLNVNIEDVKRKITPKTKAIVFVHFGGNNRGLADLLAICRERDITLIEDAAQAIGSRLWGKGNFTAISLQAIKTLTAGDGGFLICKNKKDYEKAKRLRWFGIDRANRQESDISEAGYKYHMNNISAAIGLGNLLSLDPVLAHRRRIAKIYQSYGLFAHSWLAGGFTDNYENAKRMYASNNIDIGCHDVRNDKYSLFKKYKSKCAIMDELDGKYFFVPFHYGVSDKIAHKIGKIYEEISSRV